MIYLLFVAALMPAVIIALYARITSPAEAAGGRGVLLRGLLAGILAGAVAAVLENLLSAGVELIPTQGLATYLLRYMAAMSLVQVAITLVAVMYAHKADARAARSVFDYTMSAVVVSVGLVLFEYALYLTDMGLESTLYLMLLSLPGHCAYGVVLGTYYGLARMAATQGNARKATLHLLRAFAFPLVGYAVYDAAVFSQKADVIVIALVIEIVIMLLSIADLHSAFASKRVETPMEEEPPKEGERKPAEPPHHEAPRHEEQPQSEEPPTPPSQPVEQVPPAAPPRVERPSWNPQPDRGILAVPDIQLQAKEPVVPWWQVVVQGTQQQPPQQPIEHQIPRRSELKAQQPQQPQQPQQSQQPQDPRDMTPQQQQDYLRRQRMRQQQIYEQQQRARANE